jgi:hypothetical protein
MNAAWRGVTLGLMIGFLIGCVAIVTGCEGKCSGTYACPAGIPYDSLSTTNLPSALVDVSADAPCTATLVGGDGSAASVQVIDGASSETLTCHVHGRLADGEVVEATINFQATTNSCCPGYVASGGGFSLNDAGADGP